MPTAAHLRQTLSNTLILFWFSPAGVEIIDKFFDSLSLNNLINAVGATRRTFRCSADIDFISSGPFAPTTTL
ncbi:unannotated protein [freshwater metagenome]